jgi:DNA-binding transcriptional ArsR family regulator
MRTPNHPAAADIRIESLLFALADPTRLAIVSQLDACDERTCGAFEIQVSKATAAQHFRVLRDAGVIRTRIEGKRRFLSLRRRELDQRFPGLMRAVLLGASSKPA